MKKKSKIILKSIMTFVLTIAMVLGVSMPPVYASGDTEENFTVKFKYEGKTDVYENVSSSSADFELSYILSQLEITGTVTEASVSEDQGMTVTTSMLTMSKPFGSGWLEVTVNGNKYHIVIETLPNYISVVLYGTLFFDKNGGSGEMVLTDPLDGTRKNAVYVKEYSNYQLPECGYTAPDGYEFSKWEINGNQYSAGETYVFGQTTTAKAIWKLRDGAHSISATYKTSEGEVIISPTMAVQGETVTVSVQPVAGKAVESITYSYETTSNQELILKSGETNVYEFTMPENDVTVSVTFKDVSKTPISYVDANGTPKSCDDYSFVRSNDTTWSGWVVASTNLTIDSRVNVSGTANLILMDGKTLTVTNGIQVGEGSTLNIYSQSENTGALIAGNSQNTYNAGIGGNNNQWNAGTITISGGKITAIGGYNGAGIGGATESYPKLGNAGTITILGNADVTATSGKGAAGIGNAPGGIGGSVTITGDAKVSAVGTEDSSGGGAGIGGGRNGYCDSIVISGGTVTATSSYSSAAIGTSKSGKGGTISITGGNITATGIKGSSVGIGGQCNSVTIGGTAVVTATGNTNNAGIGGFEGDSADILVNIEGGTVKAYSSGNSGAAAIGSGNKAKGKTTINISGGTIEAYGNAVYGVGIGGGNTGSSTEVVNVNITGGDVTATGRTGIGTGNASEADQTITISGGIVKASGDTYNSNNGAAIGQGNNSKSHTVINIIGGKVSADGSGNGIGAGAKSNSAPTIKLRWTDENDEYTATNYIGNVTLEKSFKNKADNTEEFLPGDLTDNSILAGKTIVPADTSKNAVLMGDISYGKVISEPRMQTAGQKVTLTVQTINGSELINDSLSVSYTVGSEMHTVELTQDSTDSNKYTFTMPDADVTVNASFISQWQKLQQQIDGDSTSIKLSGDVIAFEGEPAIRVPDGKTFTIDLNGHKIDRNLSYSIPDGYVMYVRGNLTIRDSSSIQTGTITGGNNKGLSGSCYGGGVQVEAQGSLTLESGSISENKSASYGGGVSIGSTSKFIMTGGSIVGNSAGYGAGIVARDNSTLTISDGTISNNTAGYFGGGIHVMSSAKFTMTGGSITENTAEKGAGGINYDSYEKLIVSGNANVTNNTVGGNANNVYIKSGKVLTIASEFTGNIGVTHAVTPTLDTPVVITGGLSGKGSISNFTSDNILYNLGVNDNGEAILMLADHVHSFTYASDGAVITATCTTDECTLPNHKAILTISAPAGGLVYDGTVKAAIITGDTTILGIPAIKYKSGTITLAKAPSEAGTYTASITVGGKTASVDYEIAKATPNPEIPTGLNATYGQTLADVSLAGYTGWSWAEPNTEVGNVGTSTFRANYIPNDTNNYNVLENIDLTVTVSKAENPAVVTDTAAVMKGENKINLADNVKLNGAKGTVSYSIEGESYGCTLSGSELTSGIDTGTVTVNVTVAADDNFDALVMKTITVTITDKSTQILSFISNEVNKTYGDTSFTNTLSGVNTTITYAVTDGTDVAEVNSSSGEVIIKKAGTATITATAEETTDYAGATTSYTLKVNRKAVTVKADNKSMVVGTTPEPELTATVSGTVGNDTVIYSLNREAGTVVGDYVITPSGDTLQGNYTVSYETGTFTITGDTTAPVVKKAPKAITGLVYNGTAQALVEPGEAENGTMYYAVTTENTAPEDNLYTTSNYTANSAGTYYVWCKVIGDANHSDTVAATPVEVVLAKAEQEAPESQALIVTRASNSITKDGSIYGVNDTMEYSVDGGQTWVEVPKEATDITGLSTGSVQLRYAETANYNSSPALTVRVGYGSEALSVYFASDSDSEYDQIVTYNEERERYEYVYTGSRITPVIVVEGIDKRLTEGLDYTVTYKNNINVDKKGKAAQVIVTGKGNYEKKRTVEFYILPKQLDDGNGEAAEDINIAKVVVAEGGTAAPVISYNGTILKKSEYTVTSSTGSLKFKTASEGAGATLTITAKEGGNFTGAIKDIPVTVLAKADAKKAAIKVTLAKGVSRTYNGEPQYLVIAEPEGQGGAAESDNTVAPELTVTDASGKVLAEGTDFVVSYSANVNAGTVKVTVTGIGDYTGTVTRSFKINPDKKDAEIRTYFAGETGDEMIPTDEKEAAPKFEFQKNGVKPAIIVTAVRGDEEITLSEGTDYKVSYSGNKKVGTNAKFTVTFLGNYKGRAAIKNQTFEIVKASLKDAQITVPDVTYRTYDTWSGRKYANKSVPYVTIGGVELKQGTDYTVTYWVKDEKINPNDIKFAADEQYLWITVKITGKGNYADETFESGYSMKRVAKNSTVFDLTKAKIYAKGTRKAVSGQRYLGEPIEPAIDVYVKVGSTWQLVDERFYEVHYINNIERGTAKIVVVGNGEEAVGNKKANFKIVKWQFSLLRQFLEG